MLGHRPPHDPSAVCVLNGGEIEPSLPGSEVRDVRDPQDVRCVPSELPFHQVIGDTDAGHPDRGLAVLDLSPPGDTGLAHEAPHTPSGRSRMS